MAEEIDEEYPRAYEKEKVHQTREEQDDEDLPPQIRIYNRNFYLRRAKQDLLQQQYQKQMKMIANTPKISQNSYKILAPKLQQDIRRTIQQNCINPNQITYQEMKFIVNKLNHFDQIKSQDKVTLLQQLHNQLWLLMCKYQILDQNGQEKMVNSKIFECIIRLLMDPYILKPKEIVKLIDQIEYFDGLNQMRQRFLEEYPDLVEETLDTIQIIKLWYLLKISNTQLYQKSNALLNQNQNKSDFMPQINEKSRIIADKELKKFLQNQRNDLKSFNPHQPNSNELQQYISFQNEGIPYYQILYNRKLEKDKVLCTNRQKQPQFIQKQRTAKPQQIKRIVENLYIKKERREDVDIERRIQDQEMKLCTFHPETIDYKKTKSPLRVKGFQKEVERLHKGNKEKQKRKETYQNLGRVKKSAISKVAPSFIQRDAPKLILEITMPDNRGIEQLKLKGDEDPKIAAKKFVLKHNLQPEMQSILQQLICDNLSSL